MKWMHKGIVCVHPNLAYTKIWLTLCGSEVFHTQIIKVFPVSPCKTTWTVWLYSFRILK